LTVEEVRHPTRACPTRPGVLNEDLANGVTYGAVEVENPVFQGRKARVFVGLGAARPGLASMAGV